MITSRLHRFSPVTRLALQAHARHLYAQSTSVHAQAYTHVHAPFLPTLVSRDPSARWGRYSTIGAVGVGLAAAITAAGSTVYADAPGVREPETGVHYPGTGPGGRSLAGTSVRLMGGIVQVYAVGLYVRANAVRMVAEAGEVSDNQFWDAVCERAEPLLRLVVVRQVDGHHMATGFERGLARAAKCKRPTPAMRKFAALFKPLGTMKPGSEMLIECCGESGLVELTVDGRAVGSVVDKQLAKTLPAMYLAENAVTPKLRTEAAPAIKQILAH